MTEPKQSDPLLIAVLEFYRNPLQHKAWTDAAHPLPEDAERLVDLVNAPLDAPALKVPAHELRVAPEELKTAIGFFIRQVFLASGADHYRMLGLRRDAGAEAVKDHYRKLISLFHPDREQSSLAWYDVYTVRLNRAYAELREPERRKLYDAKIAAGAPQHRRRSRRSGFSENGPAAHRPERTAAGFAPRTFRKAESRHTPGPGVIVDNRPSRRLLVRAAAGFCVIILAACLVFIGNHWRTARLPAILQTGDELSATADAVATALPPESRPDAGKALNAAAGGSSGPDVPATRTEETTPSSKPAHPSPAPVRPGTELRTAQGPSDPRDSSRQAAQALHSDQVAKTAVPKEVPAAGRSGNQPASAEVRTTVVDTAAPTPGTARKPLRAESGGVSSGAAAETDSMTARAAPAEPIPSSAGRQPQTLDARFPDSRAAADRAEAMTADIPRRVEPAGSEQAAAPAPERLSPGSEAPPALTRADLDRVLQRFIASYNRGDVENFMKMFAMDARTSDERGWVNIRRDYSEFFADTEFRRFDVRRFHWVPGDAEARGEGGFTITVKDKRKDERAVLQGVFSLRVTKDGDDVAIREFYHSYR